MFARACGWSGLVLLMTVGLCLGQEKPAGEQKAPPKAPDVKRERPPRMMGGPLGAMFDELNLDAAQQDRMKEIMEEHRKREYDIRTSFRPSPEIAEKMAAIRDEMRTAREAGDQQKLAELRDSLRDIQQQRESEMQPMRDQLEQSQQLLHDDIAGMLRDDQKAEFERVWEDRMAGPMFGGRVRTAHALRSSVKRLKGLTSEQEKKIDALFEAHQKALREQAEASRGRGAERKGIETNLAQDQLVRKLYDDVLGVLTPEQRSKIEAEFKSRERVPAMHLPGGPPPEGMGEHGKQHGEASQEKAPEQPVEKKEAEQKE